MKKSSCAPSAKPTKSKNMKSSQIKTAPPRSEAKKPKKLPLAAKYYAD